jgi:hypothetical protein
MVVSQYFMLLWDLESHQVAQIYLQTATRESPPKYRILDCQAHQRKQTLIQSAKCANIHKRI